MMCYGWIYATFVANRVTVRPRRCERMKEIYTRISWYPKLDGLLGSRRVPSSSSVGTEDSTEVRSTQLAQSQALRDCLDTCVLRW